METTTQEQIAALKESITSDAAIETERMTIRRIPTVLSDVYFSKCCTIFYIIISVLCVALLILCCCLFQHANDYTWFLIIDVALNVIFAFDVVFNMIMLKPRNYFRSRMNIITLILLIVSLMLVLLNILYKDVDFIIDDVVLVIRYSAQVLLFIAKLYRQSHENAATKQALSVSVHEDGENIIVANMASVISNERSQSVNIA